MGNQVDARNDWSVASLVFFVTIGKWSGLSFFLFFFGGGEASEAERCASSSSSSKDRTGLTANFRLPHNRSMTLMLYSVMAANSSSVELV